MSEPIRVLRVIARLNMGGPALHVAYLSAGLEERGYRTTLIPQLHREITAVGDAVAVARLVQLIRRQRPHVIHTHTAKAGAVGRMAALLAGGSPPPIVVHTFHGHVLRGYFGPARTTAFRLLERWLARASDALVAVSPQVRDDLVALGVAPAEKFAVLRLGIEVDERVASARNGGVRQTARKTLGLADGRFVVGWIGRMTAVKRTEDVLLALRALRARGVDAVLCMVGDGPGRGEVERQAHELGLARYCLYLGYQEDVAPWLAAMDAFVLPSGNEGTPASAIEALAAGKPVVATRVGGVPDVVREGETGFLVDPGDVEALGDRLARLARDPELRERLGDAGRREMPSRYAVDRLVEDVDRLYRSLLRAQRR